MQVGAIHHPLELGGADGHSVPLCPAWQDYNYKAHGQSPWKNFEGRLELGLHYGFWPH
jgi:hypothetical protein